MEISAIDTLWILFGTMFIFFMHSGFALLETGFGRVKNSSTAWIDNLLDFAIASLVFWAFGYGFMFGGGTNPIFGDFNFLAMRGYDYLELTVPNYAYVMFQGAICATTAAVVSGSMLERVNFKAFLIYSTIISGFVYPVAGHWAWGKGWLNQLNFHDFAGSASVHGLGGIIALVGAAILGARIGKYDKNGKAREMPAHSLTLAGMGTFVLWFGWFGFNGCSTITATSESMVTASNVFLSSNIAAAASTVTVLFITWAKYKKPNVAMMLNAPLAGLVAITAGCDVIEPWGAFIIGVVASFVMVFGIELVDKVFKVDDPVGAVGLHCFCGTAGTILTGLFSTENGVFYGHGWQGFGVQVLGVFSILAWGAAVMGIVFVILKFTIGLRAHKEEEIAGLDRSDFNLVETSYQEFMQIQIDPLEEKFTPVTTFQQAAVKHETQD